MCFSATASFAAAGVLGLTGSVALARERVPRRRMWAAIPVLFAVQQATEGVVWLQLDARGGSMPLSMAVTAFLGFALVVWPTWLPVSLLRLEARAGPRRRLLSLAWVGGAMSLLGLVVIALWTPGAHASHHSIGYGYPQIGGRAVQLTYFAGYLVAAVLPLFVTSLRMGRSVGGVVLAGLVVTLVIRREELTSVWCFFATAIGFLIAYDIVSRRRAAAPAA